MYTFETDGLWVSLEIVEGYQEGDADKARDHIASTIDIHGAEAQATIDEFYALVNPEESTHNDTCQEYWERGLECRCIPAGVRGELPNCK